MGSPKDLVCCYFGFWLPLWTSSGRHTKSFKHEAESVCFLSMKGDLGFLLVVPTQRNQQVGWLITSSAKWFRYFHGSWWLSGRNCHCCCQYENLYLIKSLMENWQRNVCDLVNANLSSLQTWRLFWCGERHNFGYLGNFSERYRGAYCLSQQLRTMHLRHRFGT